MSNQFRMYFRLIYPVFINKVSSVSSQKKKKKKEKEKERMWISFLYNETEDKVSVCILKMCGFF